VVGCLLGEVKLQFLLFLNYSLRSRISISTDKPSLLPRLHLLYL